MSLVELSICAGTFHLRKNMVISWTKLGGDGTWNPILVSCNYFASRQHLQLPVHGYFHWRLHHSLISILEVFLLLTEVQSGFDVSAKRNLGRSRSGAAEFWDGVCLGFGVWL